MLISLYRNDMKGRKWYRRLIFHLLDMSLVNAWLLYRNAPQIVQSTSLCSFKLDVALGLLQHSERAAQKVPTASDHIRYDQLGHFPLLLAIKNGLRCKIKSCDKKSKYICRKCQVHLCMGASDCFYKYHKC